MRANEIHGRPKSMAESWPMGTHNIASPEPTVSGVERELANIEQRLSEMQPLLERRAVLTEWLAVTKRAFPALASANQAPTSAQPQQAQEVRPMAQLSADWALPTVPGIAAKPSAAVKDQVLAAAADIWRTQGALGSRAMADAVAARGVRVGGANPAGTIATLLSKSPLFKSDRTVGGWVYVGDQQNAA